LITKGYTPSLNNGYNTYFYGEISRTGWPTNQGVLTMTEHEAEQELIRQLLEAIRNKPQTTPEK
jgi:hypothetical protein